MLNLAAKAFPGAARRRGKPLNLSDLARSASWRAQVAERHRSIAQRLKSHRDLLSACPICSDDDLELFVEISSFPFMNCKACDHLFSSQPPQGEEVRRLYTEDEEARRIHEAVYIDEALFTKRVEQITQPKVAYVTEFVKERGTWVDVGCATGELLVAARGRGFPVLGIEADPGNVAFARKRGLEIIEGYVSGDEMKQVLEEVSVLSLLNVLEHVRDPLSFLSEMTSALKPGAHVVIETPRHPSLSALSNLLYPILASRHIYAPEHLHIFSEGSMEQIVAKAGLQALGVWTFGQDAEELLATLTATSNVGAHPYLRRVSELTPALQAAIDHADFSDALFLVAVKP